MHNQGTSTLSPTNADANLIRERYQRSSTVSSSDPDTSHLMSLDTNRCKPNTSFIWCLPQDYNQEKHPFTCKYIFMLEINFFTLKFLDFHLANRALPWDYDFRFVIEEISNINDKSQVRYNYSKCKNSFITALTHHFPLQTMSISMYFAVSWMEPRLQINDSAIEWSEAITGPKNVIKYQYLKKTSI